MRFWILLGICCLEDRNPGCTIQCTLYTAYSLCRVFSIFSASYAFKQMSSPYLSRVAHFCQELLASCAVDRLFFEALVNRLCCAWYLWLFAKLTCLTHGIFWQTTWMYVNPGGQPWLWGHVRGRPENRRWNLDKKSLKYLAADFSSRGIFSECRFPSTVGYGVYPGILSHSWRG